MKKELIIGVLVLFSIIIVSSVFAKQSGNLKDSDLFLEDEGYNQKINDTTPELKSTEYHSRTDYNENSQKKPGNLIQGLLWAPVIITKVVSDNHEIISNLETDKLLH